jgi:hypothetical protein
MRQLFEQETAVELGLVDLLLLLKEQSPVSSFTVADFEGRFVFYDKLAR